MRIRVTSWIVCGSLNMDPILGNFPTGGMTGEFGQALPLSVSGTKEYSVKVPGFLLPVDGDRCSP